MAQVAVGKESVFTVAELGPKQSMTPEGFLFLEEVPICRTGDQLYAPRETPIKPNEQGYVVINREESEVFRPEFVRSFEGKPFLIGHPAEKLVSVETWKKYAAGHCINPRRGEGDLRDFLVCDVLVTEPHAISIIVNKQMNEVSAGYTAEYEEVEPKGTGRGRQYQMIGNHLALVKSARCGSRCAIQDTAEEIDQMRIPVADEATVTESQIREHFIARVIKGVMDHFKKNKVTADEAMVAAEVHKVMDEMPILMPGGTAKDMSPINLQVTGSARDEEAHTAIAALKKSSDDSFGFMKRMADKLGYKEDAATDADEEEEKKKKEAEAKAAQDAETAKRIEEETGATGDAAKAANDSALLSGAHQEACAGAEILITGITLPKFDAALKPRATLDSICGLRRSALELFSKTNDGKRIIEGLAGGKLPNFATMDCAAERVLFRAAVQGKKAANDAASRTRDDLSRQRADLEKNNKKGPIRTAKDLNTRNAEFWKKSSGGATNA